MADLINYHGDSKVIGRICELLNSMTGVSFRKVQTLPQTGESNVIYLVPKSTSETDNVFDEYIWIDNDWELIGDTEIDLSDYYTKTESDNRYAQSSSLATVATSGDYDDLIDKPTIPTVNDGTLTIQLNGENQQTFTANSSSDKTANIKAVDWVSNGKLGAKNLNSTPYLSGSPYTNNGVTYTVNADGSISLSGGTNSTQTSSYVCHSRLTNGGNALYPLYLPNGTYIFSGCPSGGNDLTKYSLRIAIRNADDTDTIYYDEGNGVKVTLNGDKYNNDKVRIQIYPFIRPNQNVTGLVFKPMVRLAEDTDNTWRPYTKTNLELTEYTKTTDNRLSPKEPEPANQDLNDYKESGVYYFTAGNAPLNVPIGSNGMLVVFKAVTDSSQNYILVKQIWLRHGTQNTNDYNTYIRTYRTDLNTWSNWHRVITNEGGSLTGNVTINNASTTTSQANSLLTLGNSTPNGTLGASRGALNIYGVGSSYAQFVDGVNVAITENRTLYLPDKTGVLAVSEDLNLAQLNERSLIYPPYYRSTPYTYREVTYTYTSDGTITANGTATGGNSNIHFRVFASNQYIKGGKAYYFKACPSGGSDSKYWAELIFGDENNTTLLSVKDYGSGVYVIAPTNAVKISTQFVIKSGYTVNNLSFKPKLVPYDGWVYLGDYNPIEVTLTEKYSELMVVADYQAYSLGNVVSLRILREMLTTTSKTFSVSDVLNSGKISRLEVSAYLDGDSIKCRADAINYYNGQQSVLSQTKLYAKA